MDLPYPSHPKVGSHPNLKSRKSLSLKQSLKLFPTPTTLTKKNKEKILKNIQQDNPSKLKSYLQKQVINFHSQIGKQNSNQTMLHLCCKHDAIQCLEFILKSEYQNYPQSYEALVNGKNAEGLTSIMVGILNCSNLCVGMLLEYGGVDIHAIDKNKMNGYQLAMNTKNQYAVGVLMNYENRSKKFRTINKAKLMEELSFVPQDQSCCLSFYRGLLNCLTCGNYEEQPRVKQKFSKRKISLLNLDKIMMDVVDLGFKGQELQKYGEYQWKMLDEIGYGQQALFDNFTPSDIYYKNKPLKNMLIILQSLSQHPWLLRRILKKDPTKKNTYNLTINDNNNNKTVTIDQNITFCIENGEPMFVCDRRQNWPMIVQKGLAKYYKSYKMLSIVRPEVLIANLTGFNTVRRSLAEIGNPKEIIKFIEKLNDKGFLYFLEGKKDSYLCDGNGEVDCFTVLSFFTKGDKKLMLVNCPFVDEDWLQKQKYEMLSLKMIKTHYNSTNQMAMWIEQDKIADYFSNIIVSTILPKHERSQTHLNSRGIFYFKFTVSTTNEEPLLLQLWDIETKNNLDLRKIEIYRDQRDKVKLNREMVCMEEFAGIQCLEGDYFCRFEGKKREIRKYMLAISSGEQVVPEYLEQSFGIVQYISILKNTFLDEVEEMESQTKIYVKTYDQYSIIVIKQELSNFHLTLTPELKKEQIIEGELTDKNKLKLMVHGRQFYYAILRGSIELKDISYSRQ